MLDAWRELGADRLDPVRFSLIVALERRAAGHGGEVRRILDDRLSTLLDAYAEAVAGADCTATAQAAPARGALGGLVDYMAGHAPAEADGALSYPELEALGYFRDTWSRLSSERQLRQSQAQVPGNAGPLNSNSLVHRSLSLMRELSPGYLQQFLSYVDALSWMEQLNVGSALAKDAPRGGGVRKSVRGRTRQV